MACFVPLVEGADAGLFRLARSEMTVLVDPAGNEVRALLDLVALEEREVLEIGCGDGRLTWRYADRVAHVTAIDPFAEAIDRAREHVADRHRERVELRHVAFEDFANATERATFDVILLSWSLC
jgi:2-polyprenyl-3-methyl-5-hydroxy-6-metoxy-1,4-benzoquinol methylase